jgi:hypothetical protein
MRGNNQRDPILECLRWFKIWLLTYLSYLVPVSFAAVFTCLSATAPRGPAGTYEHGPHHGLVAADMGAWAMIHEEKKRLPELAIVSEISPSTRTGMSSLLTILPVRGTHDSRHGSVAGTGRPLCGAGAGAAGSLTLAHRVNATGAKIRASGSIMNYRGKSWIQGRGITRSRGGELRDPGEGNYEIQERGITSTRTGKLG